MSLGYILYSYYKYRYVLIPTRVTEFYLFYVRSTNRSVDYIECDVVPWAVMRLLWPSLHIIDQKKKKHTDHCSLCSNLNRHT